MTRRNAPADPPFDPVGALQDIGAVVREVDALLHAVAWRAGELPDGPAKERVQLLLGITERMAEEALSVAKRWLERAMRR